jgi:hypothetical protein
MLMPLAGQARLDVTSTETLFTKKRSTNAGKLLVSRPQTGLAGRRGCANFIITRDKEGRLGAVPLLGTQNAVVSVGNTDRLVPNEGLVEVLVTEVVGVTILGSSESWSQTMMP